MMRRAASNGAVAEEALQRIALSRTVEIQSGQLRWRDGRPVYDELLAALSFLRQGLRDGRYIDSRHEHYSVLR